MSLQQHFNLYSLSETLDASGSPAGTVVEIFDMAEAVFTSPSSRRVNAWFGEGVQFDLVAVIHHSLVNDPIGGISLFSYLDIDTWPFLYLVIMASDSLFYEQPFRVTRVNKRPQPGVGEKIVLGLRRPAPDERVVWTDAGLVAVE